MIMLMILTLAIGAALFIIFCLDLFSFAQLLVKGSSITSEDMKLYGEIFSAIILILSSAALCCTAAGCYGGAAQKNLGKR